MQKKTSKKVTPLAKAFATANTLETAADLVAYVMSRGFEDVADSIDEAIDSFLAGHRIDTSDLSPRDLLDHPTVRQELEDLVNGVIHSMVRYEDDEAKAKEQSAAMKRRNASNARRRS